jgi:hypothetical protein
MEDEHLDLKFITNIGAHDIIKKYDASLQQQIILSLSAVDWTSIDVVRIGTNCSIEDPVILWIAVVAGSLSFQEGFKVACHCRAILLQVGLDIHCEIREATVQSAAAGASEGKQLLSPAASALLPHLYPDGSQRPSSLSWMLGSQAIAAEETPNREGTLSLYLSVGGTKCALLSRHVICEDDQGLTRHERPIGQVSTNSYAIMPGQATYEKICAEEKANLTFWESPLGDKHPEQQEVCKQLVQHLALLEDIASRRIGRIFFSPPRIPVSCRLLDYALVALDHARFGPYYDNLHNMVYLGQIGSRDLKMINRGKPTATWKRPGTELRLSGVFAPGDGRVVGQCGRTTGLA